jgi:hypothetical protein
MAMQQQTSIAATASSRRRSAKLPARQTARLRALLVAGLLAGTAPATEYFVATTGLDSNSGADWSQPLLTISNGVAKATSAGAGSTVTVSNGTYNISAEIALNQSITVRSFGNGVYGGLANAAATIVKGGTGNQHIFNVTADATVDGFTMRDAVRSSGTMLGGGVYVNSSGAVVQNCIMVNNNGDTMYGCGAYVVAGLVRNCTILNNGNGDRINGGNVYLTGGVVSNCVISGGRAWAAACVWRAARSKTARLPQTEPVPAAAAGSTATKPTPARSGTASS